MTHVSKGRCCIIIGCLAATLAMGGLGGVPTAFGAQLTEELCLSRRARAAGVFARKVQEAMMRYELGEDLTTLNIGLGKCLDRYAKAWEDLEERFRGTQTTCDNPRFEDNGATVTDRLTGLEWEKKVDSLTTDPHDKDDKYSWSTSDDGDPTDADGSIHTVLLPELRSPCFGGDCDWRLPTWQELLTIVRPQYPNCSNPPCIHPIFGPMAGPAGTLYWSSISNSKYPEDAWAVNFYDGRVINDMKIDANYVRVVRCDFGCR